MSLQVNLFQNCFELFHFLRMYIFRCKRNPMLLTDLSSHHLYDDTTQTPDVSSTALVTLSDHLGGNVGCKNKRKNLHKRNKISNEFYQMNSTDSL